MSVEPMSPNADVIPGEGQIEDHYHSRAAGIWSQHIISSNRGGPMIRIIEVMWFLAILRLVTGEYTCSSAHPTAKLHPSPLETYKRRTLCR